MDWIEYLQFVINSIKNPQQSSYMMPNSSAIENGLDTLMSTNSILDLLRMNSGNNSFIGIEQQQQVGVKFSITFYLRFHKNVFLLGTVESTLQLESAHKSIGAA